MSNCCDSLEDGLIPGVHSPVMDELKGLMMEQGELVLDPAIIAQLEEIRGFDGAGVLPELIAVFVSSARSRLTRIGGCLDSGDLTGAGRHAHSLAGSAGSLGARRLAGLCRELRGAASGGDTADARATLAEMRVEFERARTALDNL